MNGVLLNVGVENIEEAEVNHEMLRRPMGWIQIVMSPWTKPAWVPANTEFGKFVDAPLSIQPQIIRL
jgi:hypothetical protein